MVKLICGVPALRCADIPYVVVLFGVGFLLVEVYLDGTFYVLAVLAALIFHVTVDGHMIPRVLRLLKSLKDTKRRQFNA
jgi:hypothetical protein